MSREELLESKEVNELLESILEKIHNEIDELITDCFVTGLLEGFNKAI